MLDQGQESEELEADPGHALQPSEQPEGGEEDLVPLQEVARTEPPPGKIQDHEAA